MNSNKIALVFLIGCFLKIPFVFAQSDRNNLQLLIDPMYFSPNKDSLQDQIFFHPVLKTSQEINRWELDIVKPGKKKVAQLTGAGFPALIKWDGLDKKGGPVPDGEYQARLNLKGRSRNFTAEQPFFVDTHVPAVTLVISTNVFDKTFLDNGSLRFTPTITDDSPIDRWLLQVIDSTGRTVQVFWSTGPVREISWNGTDQSTKVLIPQGSYRCVFQAWDKAGNESPPVFADLTVAVTARQMLEQALHLIQINETAIGLIVQLRAEDLFNLKRKGAVVSEQGKQFLSELSVLINAYPNAPVKLDGYSKANKQAAKDRANASLYAWRVYSYLIKSGNVKASRLNVRGRGRSAMFDRRSVAVPVLQNGVEIILEGRGDW